MKRLYFLILFCAYFLSYPGFAFSQMVGINITVPEVTLDIRSTDNKVSSELNLGNLNNDYFLRLFSGRSSLPKPRILWKSGIPLSLATADADGSNLSEFLLLDGKTIGIYNTGSSIFLGADAGTNDDGSNNQNVAIGQSALQDNSSGHHNTALGTEAGLKTTGSGNVFLGYQVGASASGDNILYIDNSSTNNPLIKGDFAADSLEINGKLAVKGKLNVADDANLANKGDIRWNENTEDFEGYNGEEWLSLTAGNSTQSNGSTNGYGGVKDLCPATSSDGNAGDVFGDAIDINGDWAIIGARQHDLPNDNNGAAYIFQRQGNCWVEHFKLTASDAQLGDAFGGSVAISNDYAIVGAKEVDGPIFRVGAAYIFERQGNTWVELIKLVPPVPQSQMFYGSSVDIEGDYAVVSAISEDIGGNLAQGAVYVYHQSGGTWTFQTKLTEAAVGTFFFGYATKLAGDYLAIGTFGDRVFIYKRSGSTWTQEAVLLPPNGGTTFGTAIDFSGDHIIVGQRWTDVGSNVEQGSAYIFQRSGTTWTVTAQLIAWDGKAEEEFGRSVAISGNYALVGTGLADYFDPCGTQLFDRSGKAYLFELKNNAWVFHSSLTDPELEEDAFFGTECVIEGTTFLIGSSATVNGMNNRGRVLFGKIK